MSLYNVAWRNLGEDSTNGKDRVTTVAPKKVGGVYPINSGLEKRATLGIYIGDFKAFAGRGCEPIIVSKQGKDYILNAIGEGFLEWNVGCEDDPSWPAGIRVEVSQIAVLVNKEELSTKFGNKLNKLEDDLRKVV